MTGPPPPTRRRSSVTFQLADVQALQQQLRMSPTLINNSAAAAAARGTPGAGEGGEGIGVRARRALPLPLLVFGVGMVAMVSEYMEVSLGLWPPGSFESTYVCVVIVSVHIYIISIYLSSNICQIKTHTPQQPGRMDMGSPSFRLCWL